MVYASQCAKCLRKYVECENMRSKLRFFFVIFTDFPRASDKIHVSSSQGLSRQGADMMMLCIYI